MDAPSSCARLLVSGHENIAGYSPSNRRYLLGNRSHSHARAQRSRCNPAASAGRKLPQPPTAESPPVRVAVVFPGQGTQDPAWACRGATTRLVGRRRAEAALGEPLAHLLTDAPDEPRPHTRTRSSRCCSPRSSRGRRSRRSPTTSSRSPATRSDRSPRSSPSGVLPLDDGVRFAARRAELTQAAADAHPGRMAALLGATARAGRGRVRRRARRRAGSPTTTRRARS